MSMNKAIILETDPNKLRTFKIPFSLVINSIVFVQFV